MFFHGVSVKHARKLNIVFDWGDLSKDRFIIGEHGVRKNFAGYGVVRRHISQKKVARFKTCLPASIQPAVAGACFSEIQLLAPHLHYKEGCVINFYKHTGGEATTFWDGEIEIDSTDILDNGNDYYNVNIKKIQPVESFVASVGDVWVLDSKQTHSVSKFKEGAPHNMQFFEEGFSPRFIVQVYMTLPFNEIAKAFD